METEIISSQLSVQTVEVDTALRSSGEIHCKKSDQMQSIHWAINFFMLKIRVIAR